MLRVLEVDIGKARKNSQRPSQDEQQEDGGDEGRQNPPIREAFEIPSYGNDHDKRQEKMNQSAERGSQRINRCGCRVLPNVRLAMKQALAPLNSREQDEIPT